MWLAQKRLKEEVLQETKNQLPREKYQISHGLFWDEDILRQEEHG